MDTNIERKELGGFSPFNFLQGEPNAPEKDQDEIARVAVEDDTEDPIDNHEPPAPAADEEDGRLTDPPKAIEEEEEEEQPEIEYDVKISGNPIEIIAKDWKTKGYLPDDFEVSNDITDEELEQAYRTYKYDNIRQEITQEVISELQELGYTEEVLETAKRIKQGVPQEQISKVDLLKFMGTMQIDPNQEDFEPIVRSLFTQFYLDKGFKPEKAERYVERDLGEDDDTIMALVSEYQEHFRNQGIQLEQQMAYDVERREQERQAAIEKEVKDIKRMLSTGVLGNRKYTQDQMKTVERALFEKTEVFVDASGKRHRVTAYDKKKLEYASNPELNLQSIADFILGIDAVAPAKDERDRQQRRGLLHDLEKSVQVTIKGAKDTTVDARGIERRELSPNRF